MKQEILAVILALLVVGSLGVGYLIGTGNQHTITMASTDTTTATTTVTVLISSLGGPATILNSTLQAECTRAQAPTAVGFTFGELSAGTKSPAIICIQFYYFNSTAPLTIDFDQVLSIQALQYIQNGTTSYPRSFDGGSNFTIATSQAMLSMGGPDNENEGAVVAFALTAKAGASGTYRLNLLSYPGLGGSVWMLNPQEPVRCGYYGELVAGNGQPDYTGVGGFSGCITYTTYGTTTTTSSSPLIPGVQYPVLTGYVYFRAVGVINST
jgi:hypothetical protein